MDTLPSQDATEKEIAADKEERPRGNDCPNVPSADFAALINAITIEGRANRAEEQREDRGKKIREWLTILLLATTMVAIFWQVYEMVHVYGPIHDQAIASKVSADASKIAAEAATKQSENSDKALVQAQRAWVGPQNANIATEPTIGKPVEITIQYQNSGHEPALGFVFSVEPFLFTPAEEANGTVGTKILNYMNACKNTKHWLGGSVIYPSIGFSAYSLNTKTNDDFIDENFTKDERSMIVQGCFLYRTFDLPRHSYFCYFYKQGYTKPQNLNICVSGHDAD